MYGRRWCSLFSSTIYLASTCLFTLSVLFTVNLIFFVPLYVVFFFPDVLIGMWRHVSPPPIDPFAWLLLHSRGLLGISFCEISRRTLDKVVNLSYFLFH